MERDNDGVPIIYGSKCVNAKMNNDTAGYYVISDEMMGRIFDALGSNSKIIKQSLDDHNVMCGRGEKNEKQKAVGSMYAQAIVESNNIITSITNKYGFIPNVGSNNSVKTEANK